MEEKPHLLPLCLSLNELYGKTLGIVGLGAIGQQVANIILRRISLSAQ